jgi:hypothetical protein
MGARITGQVTFPFFHRDQNTRPADPRLHQLHAAGIGRRAARGDRRVEEAGSWYGELLARRDALNEGTDGRDSADWARVLHGSALQLWARTDLTQAAAREESAVEIFRAADDRRWLTYGLSLLARVRTGQGQLAEARALLNQARTVWRGVESSCSPRSK